MLRYFTSRKVLIVSIVMLTGIVIYYSTLNDQSQSMNKPGSIKGTTTETNKLQINMDSELLNAQGDINQGGESDAEMQAVGKEHFEKIEQQVAANIQRYNENLNDPLIKKEIENNTLLLTQDYKKEVLKKVKAANSD